MSLWKADLDLYDKVSLKTGRGSVLPDTAITV
jgi:hypothetical protein